MPKGLYNVDYTVLALAAVSVALALYGLWKGHVMISLRGSRDVEDQAREVIELDDAKQDDEGKGRL